MIIAFAGRKQSGKTTSAEYVKGLFDNMSTKIGWVAYNAKIYNFADPLKQLCIDILGLEYNQCYGTDEDKNQTVDCYWDGHQLTAREVLQIVGTDMFRTMQHNVWSSATIRRINKENPNLAIIADCRFSNEVEAIKNAGGIVIKLTRNPYNSSHSSEIALDPEHFDQSTFDMVIDNSNLTISEQNTQIHNFLQHKGFLPL